MDYLSSPQRVKKVDLMLLPRMPVIDLPQIRTEILKELSPANTLEQLCEKLDPAYSQADILESERFLLPEDT